MNNNKKVITNISNDGNYTWIQIDKDENFYYELTYESEQKKIIRRSFLEFKDKQLKYFVLYSLNNGKKYVFNIDSDKQEILFFKRHIVNVMTEGEDIIYVVGIKNKETGDTQYTYILPDDNVYITNNSNYVNSLYENNMISNSIKIMYEELGKGISGGVTK